MQVYPFLQYYAGDLGGYDEVINFYNANPEYPVHVYFHWYSAVRRDSLEALKRVLDWCMTQLLEPVTVVEYTNMIKP